MQRTLLFDSVHSAGEIAFMLCGEWDRCNAVTFSQINCSDIAFQTALKLVSAEYCIEQEVCYLKELMLPSNTVLLRKPKKTKELEIVLLSQDLSFLAHFEI